MSDSTGGDGEKIMLDEQTEFAISQYADGTLPASQRAIVESWLSTEPQAVALLDEYRRMATVLRDASPLPAIDWNRLESHLSQAVAKSDRAAAEGDNYSMPWVRRLSRLAVAACMVAGVFIAFRLVNQHPSTPALSGQTGQIAVAGPAAEAPAGAVVAEISVGPSPALAMDDSTWRYGDSGVVAQQQRVVIASSDASVQDTPGQDTPATPY